MEDVYKKIGIRTFIDLEKELEKVKNKNIYMINRQRESFFMLFPLQVSWFLGWLCGNLGVLILSVS